MYNLGGYAARWPDQNQRPLFIVGLTYERECAFDYLYSAACTCLVALADRSRGRYPYYEAVVLVLATLWAENGTRALDHVTREMSFRLGLV